ncbi:MAG: hypothetical protein WA885_07105 [Phormidesmis sp.]
MSLTVIGKRHRLKADEHQLLEKQIEQRIEEQITPSRRYLAPRT